MEGPFVSFVGAGPGDPGLITVKGVHALEQADVIIYDYLAKDALLAYARPDAELVYVGKKGFTRHITQDEITALLITKATRKSGQHVVRLKGGDPFVFGRGGEEALALQAAGIPYEVIPGISAGIAAPAYAGIPITHRNVASSVTFVTGHEDPTKAQTSLDWEHLAKGADTLCFFMGVKNLPLIVQNLLTHGRAADEPVALIEWGTTPQQHTLTATLGTVLSEVERNPIGAPAIIVVGPVVKLRNKLAWFERAPLFGQRVVVTRARAQASTLTHKLEALGAEVLEFPAIQIEPVEDIAPLKRAAQTVGTYDWLVLTSTNGVEYFFEMLLTCGKDARALAGVQVAAIGNATAQKLIEFGVVPDFVPAEYRAEALLEGLTERGVAAGSRVLLVRAKKARNVLPDGLTALGAQVDVVAAYQTSVATDDKTVHDTAALVELLQDHKIDAITFTSSSTVTNFVDQLAAAAPDTQISQLLEGVTLASIGPVTSKKAQELGLRISVEAQEYTIAGLVDALVAAQAATHV